MWRYLGYYDDHEGYLKAAPVRLDTDAQILAKRLDQLRNKKNKEQLDDLIDLTQNFLECAVTYFRVIRRDMITVMDMQEENKILQEESLSLISERGQLQRKVQQLETLLADSRANEQRLNDIINTSHTMTNTDRPARPRRNQE